MGDETNAGETPAVKKSDAEIEEEKRIAAEEYRHKYTKELRDAYIAEQKALDPNFTFVESEWKDAPVWTDGSFLPFSPQGVTPTPTASWTGNGNILLPALAVVLALMLLMITIF